MNQYRSACCLCLIVIAFILAAQVSARPEETGAKAKMPGTSSRERNKSNFECAFRQLEETRIPELHFRSVPLAEATAFLQSHLPAGSCVSLEVQVERETQISTEEIEGATAMEAIRAVARGADRPITFDIRSTGVVVFSETKHRKAIFYVDSLPIDIEKFRNELVANGFEVEDRFRDEENRRISMTNGRLSHYFKRRGLDLKPETQLQIFLEPARLQVVGTLEDIAEIEDAMRPFLRSENILEVSSISEGAELHTHVFRVDSELLKQRIKETGVILTRDNDGIFATRRVVGDFPRQERGEDLRIITRDRPGSVLESGGLNFVTKPNVLRTANDSVRAFFEKHGITLTPPESAFLADRRGELIIRARLTTIKSVHSLLESSLKERTDE